VGKKVDLTKCKIAFVLYIYIYTHVPILIVCVCIYLHILYTIHDLVPFYIGNS